MPIEAHVSQVMELRDENAVLRAALTEREQRIAEHAQQIALHEQLLADRARLIAHLERELGRVAELESQIQLLVEQLESAAGDKRALEARLKELLAKRRAMEHSQAGQLHLAFQGEPPLPTPPCANEAPDGETPGDKLRPRHQRQNAARKLAYESLPREHVRHELEPSERICKVTGKPLVEIGEKLSEQIEFQRAKLFVVVHHRAVYGLGEVDRSDRQVEPVVAVGPVQPIEDARASASLVARILEQKYCNHLPLYRQQAIFQREGLALPRQTMCDWVMAAAFNLAPIQQALKKRIVASGVVQLDDTPVKCQSPPGEPVFEARLWTYASPLEEGVVFDFALDRGHQHVLEFLGPDIQGYLVGDGYAGYGTIARKRPGVIEAGCWAHALRKFRDALKESPAEATRMIAMMRTLFEVEAHAIDHKLTHDAVHALRAERSRPAIERIRALNDELLKVERSEKASMTVALKYVRNQWDALIAFLEDGRVPIHNNSSERSIRPIAVGRRNWLFAGSKRGGEAAATVYSLIESCRRVDVNPYDYLTDVLVRVATHPASRVDELTPDQWKKLFAGRVAG